VDGRSTKITETTTNGFNIGSSSLRDDFVVLSVVASLVLVFTIYLFEKKDVPA